MNGEASGGIESETRIVPPGGKVSQVGEGLSVRPPPWCRGKSAAHVVDGSVRERIERWNRWTSDGCFGKSWPVSKELSGSEATLDGGVGVDKSWPDREALSGSEASPGIFETNCDLNSKDNFDI